MNEVNYQEIIEKWYEVLEEHENKLHQKVKDSLKRARCENEITIWLGGPGKSSDLYHLRELIQMLLHKRGFNDVIISEEYPSGSDIASKEIQEIVNSDLIIILLISPGSAAESIEFAYQSINYKLFIYIPEEFEEGYVFRALFGKHSLIREDSKFSLNDFKSFQADLPIKVIKRIESYCFDQYRINQMN